MVGVGAPAPRGYGIPLVPGGSFGILRHDYSGVAWYRRSVLIPANWKAKPVTLHIGGALRITELTTRADSAIVGLRVGVKNGGCAGQSYTVEYAHEVRPTDEVVEDKGVKILVDPKAVLFLLGTEMDYKADKMQAQFIFNNPNQVSACGCGESVQLTPAKV